MNNRCPDCNRFVSLEQEEPEADVDITSREPIVDTQQELTITGSVRLVLVCAECGTEMAEANLDVEEEHTFCHAKSGCQGTVAAETEAELADRYEGKGRGMRHFYGVDLTVILECEECNAHEEVSIHEEEQADSFDELV